MLRKHLKIQPPPPEGNPPKQRNVLGVGPYTYGVIGRQPGSDWKLHLAEAERSRTQCFNAKESSMLNELKQDTLTSKFELRTNKRNIVSRIREKVDLGLKVVEQKLEIKRNRLRALLLSEENDYLREYVDRAQHADDAKMVDMKSAALQLKLAGEADHKALAEAKQLQQFKNNCSLLISLQMKENRRETAAAQLKQIKENEAKKEEAREQDMMWSQLNMKDFCSRRAYEEQQEQQRVAREREQNEVLKQQMLGLKALQAERRSVVAHEAAHQKKIQEEIRREDEIALQEKMEKIQKIRIEAEEFRRQSEDIKKARELEVKVVDSVFDQAVSAELEKERARIVNTKVAERRESELFRYYLEEAKVARAKENARLDELISKVAEETDQRKELLRLRSIQARDQLKKEVLQTRGLQVAEKCKRQEEKLMKRLDEVALSDIRRQQNLKLIEEKDKMIAMEKKQYAQDLKTQMEANKLRKEEERAEMERLCQSNLQQNEQVKKATREMITHPTGESPTHPFLKQMRGQAHLL